MALSQRPPDRGGKLIRFTCLFSGPLLSKSRIGLTQHSVLFCKVRQEFRGIASMQTLEAGKSDGAG